MPSMTILTLKQYEFLHSEIISLTFSASLSRNKVYSPQTTETQKREFRKGLEIELKTLGKNYVNHNVSEQKHENNICYLADMLSSKYGLYLEKQRFRIGTAQKALNLYLKYLWCLGKVVEPPHFPIDAIMLAKIPNCSSIRWTKLDSINEYRQIIQKAKNVLEGYSLAEWELREYTG